MASPGPAAPPSLGLSLYKATLPLALLPVGTSICGLGLESPGGHGRPPAGSLGRAPRWRAAARGRRHLSCVLSRTPQAPSSPVRILLSAQTL